jgi:ubiquitin-conjugating enzyme E2 variant
MTPAKAPSEFPLRPLEVVSVVAALALVGTQFVRFAGRPEFWGLPTLAAVALGLLAADFVSGVVHWAGDTWGDDQTGVIGPRFIRPFRFHHAHPHDMLNSHFFTTNGDTSLASLPFLLAPFLLPLDTDGWRFAAVFLWAVGGWGMWTHQFHRWAHTKHPPRAVRWLQRAGVILRPDHHWRHHKEPFAVNYCITTGWCDPVLTRVRFFPALEWIVSGLTGWRPRGEPRRRTQI